MCYRAWEKTGRVHDELRSILLLLKLLGALPVDVSFTDRRPKLRLVSRSLVYCLMVYVLVVVGMWEVHGHEFDSNMFDDSILAFYHLVLMLLVACLPFTFWRDSGPLVRYLHTWENTLDVRVLLPSMKTRSTVLTVLIVCVSVLLELIYQLFSVPFYTLQFLTDVHVLALRLSTVALWHVLCLSLCRAASTLLHRLSQELRTSPQPRNTVLTRNLRKWLHLAQLVGLLGKDVNHIYNFFIVYMFAKMTLNVYWTLGTLLFSETRRTVAIVYICISIAMDLGLIFVFCDDAERVHSKVGDQFQELLLNLKVLEPDMTHEIDTFLLEIQCSRPVMDLNGYVQVSRRLLVTLGSTMVTYLVVLLQFKLSNMSPHNKMANATVV